MTTADTETQAIHLLNPTLIDPPDFNSRVSFDDDEVNSLMESIKRDGQHQPVQVYANGDSRYVLNFGSRRVEACKRAEMLVKAIVVEAPASPKEAAFKNGEENLQREDLTTFEQARLFARLRELDTKIDEIADRLGFTKGYVSEMTKNYVKLADPIKDAWERASSIQRERNPGKLSARQAAEMKACSAMFLRELVGESEPKQVELFESAVNEIMKEREAADAKEGGTTAKKGKKGKGPAAETMYKVGANRYAEVTGAFKRLGTVDAKTAIKLCQYMVGDIDKVKGVIEPAPKQEPKK